MTDDEALCLLLKYRNPEEDIKIHEVRSAETIAVQELSGLPLAIAQAGSYIFNNNCTYFEYLEELRDCPQELLEDSLGIVPLERNQKPVWSSLTLSIRRIQELPETGFTEAIELLRIMSFLHHDGITTVCSMKLG